MLEPGLDVSGHHIHEEVHVNGIAGKASFHFDSPMVKGCITVDLPAPLADQISAMAPMMDAQLQQAESMAPMIVQQVGFPNSVDGDDCVMLEIRGASDADVLQVGFSKYESHPKVVVDVGAPGLFGALAVKFSDYHSHVDESTRACEVEGQETMQTFLSSSPEARSFVTSRIDQHQHHLQALLQPKALNTRFNFAPLELVKLLVPVEQDCASALAETPIQSFSVAGSVVLGIFSMSMGVAVSQGLMRQRKVSQTNYVIIEDQASA